MNFLFVHQSYPTQFKHLAPALVRRGHDVRGLSKRVPGITDMDGVKVHPYTFEPDARHKTHPWVTMLNKAVDRAQACFDGARVLRDEHGFTPDVIVAHHAWAEGMFLKQVWPDAKLGMYWEFYQNDQHPMAMFSNPEFERDFEREACWSQIAQLYNEVQFKIYDAGITPTQYQASLFPQHVQDRTTVIHDGIETHRMRRRGDEVFDLPNGRRLTAQSQVITLVNRNMEPIRGFGVFMRSLPKMLKECPDADVVIVGGDLISYGSAPQCGGTWRQLFTNLVRPHISDEDWARVHFVGQVPYDKFQALLAITKAHVYLTFPFVLSWSMMEAMSFEAPIVGSATAPVQEVLTHGENARLVDFYDLDALVREVSFLLKNPDEARRLGANARAKVVQDYDLNTVCLPAQLKWLESFVGQPV